MTWPWHISSEPISRVPGLHSRTLAVLLAVQAAGIGQGAGITGSVRLLDSHDPAVQKHNDYSGVVIWLERRDGTTVPVVPKAAQMAQQKKHFVPPVLAVPVGSTVSFPNFDPIFHNAFSNFAGQIFDVGLYPPRTDQRVRFRQPGISAYRLRFPRMTQGACR